MNENFYTADILYKNTAIRTAKNSAVWGLIVLVIGAAIAIAGFIITGGGDEFQPFIAFASIFLILFSIAFWIIVISLLVGLKRKSYLEQYVEEHGEDLLVSELNQNSVFIYKDKKGNPITFLTNNRIYEVGRKFVELSELDMAYGYSYKGATSIRTITKYDKYNDVCSNIGLKSNNYNEFFKALYQIKPSVLLGYTAENLKIHKEHVKEAKRELKNR